MERVTTIIIIFVLQSICQCKEGFHKEKNSTECTLIDICGSNKNTTCDTRATCSTVQRDGVISVDCKVLYNII